MRIRRVLTLALFFLSALFFASPPLQAWAAGFGAPAAGALIFGAPAAGRPSFSLSARGQAYHRNDLGPMSQTNTATDVTRSVRGPSRVGGAEVAQRAVVFSKNN